MIRKGRSTLWDGAWGDVRYAVRSLRNAPAFTTIALLCLAIGIGANTTMFGVAEHLFLKPPAGVQDPGRVVRLYLERRMGGMGGAPTPVAAPGSYPDYTDLRGATKRTLKDIAAYTASEFSFGVGPTARQWDGQYVTAGYFGILGTRPELGRFFLAEEDSVAGAHPVAVISYGCWQRDFGGDPRVIGRAIQLDARPYTIIGVAQRGFSGFDLNPVEVWLPFAQIHGFFGPEILPERHAIWLSFVARLAPGVAAHDAELEATGIKRRVDAVAARDLDPNVRVIAAPLLAALGPQRGPSATIALWVSGAVAFVLLIACANVANLLLARGASREREFAVRLSLGARRSHLIRQLLIESFLLASVGAALGAVLSVLGAGSLKLLSLPAAGLDLFALAFTGAIALATALAAGLAPALLTTRASVMSSIASATGRLSRRPAILQAGLLALQAALSLVVLAGAGLFVRSLRNARAVDLGIDATHIVTTTIGLDQAGYDSAARAAFYNRAVERLSALPGVAGASYVGLPPFQGMMGLLVSLPGQDTAHRDRRPFMINFAAPDIIRVDGARLLQGRDLSPADRAGTLPVAVINETMARRLWPTQTAIGQCFLVSTGPESSGAPPCTYVVGIMADGKYEELAEPPTAYFMVPYAQRNPGMPPTLIVRTSGDPHQLIPQVRKTLAGLAPNLPYIDVHALADVLDPQFKPYRIGAVLFTLFGIVALALAAVGLYGVVSYVVAQRSREAGIRLALGAHATDVIALMLKQGVMPAVAGGVLGLVGAFIVTRFISSQLFGVSPADPLTFVSVAILLTLVSVLACYLPARRAARVDPVTTLRSE